MGPNDRFAGVTLTTGSAGTIASGDYLKQVFPTSKIAAGEAVQCPTILYNGFGEHRIKGIGDKHIPWVHNVKRAAFWWPAFDGGNLHRRVCDHMEVDWMRNAIGAVLTFALVVGACGGSEPTIELSELASTGRQATLAKGCAACHGQSGEGAVGPAWQGLYDSVVELEGGGSVVANDAYLRRAILDPESETVLDAAVVMPPSTLSDSEVEAVIAYIKELQ
ncbi:MAG: c-type cytochrome [bacterium]|nr:c-type cytochrome [bacterium]